MTKLNQLIAVEKGVKDEATRQTTDAYHAIKRPDAHTGIARRYTPLDEDGEELPPENRRVQVKAEELLENVTDKLARLWDVIATKDFTNTTARGSIVVDETTVVADVPVTTLLWLEKQLTDVSTFVSALPQLDLGREWHEDATAGAWASTPEQTKRTQKVMRNHVIAEATVQHPAQVQVYTEDNIVGTWTTTHYSGALPTQAVDELKERVAKLQRAVKFAREEANSITVTDKKIGEALVQYILEG